VEAEEHFSSPIFTFHFSRPSNVPPVHLPPLFFFKPSYILEQRGRSVQSKTSPIAYELMQDYANNCRQTMFLLSMLGRNLSQEVEVQPRIDGKFVKMALQCNLQGSQAELSPPPLVAE